MSGVKLMTVPASEGKLIPESIATQAYGRGDVQRAQPLVVSLTQATELGTVYTPGEINWPLRDMPIRWLPDYAPDSRAYRD